MLADNHEENTGTLKPPFPIFGHGRSIQTITIHTMPPINGPLRP